MHDEHDAETSALLDQLGALAREQLSTREPEWEEFARGELAEHELRAASDDDDDDFERSLELFRPLDDDARERMTAALLSATAPEGASQASWLALRSP